MKVSIKGNEVFSILGHNGAGKTTAIYMLTGMLQPTSGDAILYDNAVTTGIDEIRRNMGLCQQFDVLYEELTSQQHLELVCKIKGIGSDSPRQIEQILELVMLTRHRDKKPKEMSGGMKRKLSLAMALIGDSRTIILDEPTSGLDVESRRQVWDLILKIKEQRSIIMSTQHIEEADVLSNRICVMSHGKVIALDTPNNIKRRFGVGYNILLEPINVNEMSAQEIKHLANRAREAVLTSGGLSGEANLQLEVQSPISPSLCFAKETKDSTDKRLIFVVPY
jgi:ATP-binding cassette, subfamily A (ABC1), member 3